MRKTSFFFFFAILKSSDLLMSDLEGTLDLCKDRTTLRLKVGDI